MYSIVDGGWSDWTQWGDCSVTCGGGEKYRYRNCTNPKPQFGGDNCTGHTMEMHECGDTPCPGTVLGTRTLFILKFITVDCEWNDWSNWTQCTVTCDGGVQVRTRTKKTEALHNGQECTGANNETRSCNTEECPSKCISGGLKAF